uniref:Zinc fingers and homeoboxes protein 1 n=1 Tax=Cynoglossus semilaevis TaxID=244447 RepID=A0A3P8VTP7_CYNSE
MSSRRKSTTPCMVLPSNVVEQEELEEKTDRTKKEEEVEREEGKMKRGAEEGPSAEELEQAVVVVPTPPDTGDKDITLELKSLYGTNVSSVTFPQVLSAFQAQQTAAAAQSQLLIPLSSIPSYNAAMDSNPLLGSTYKKFPYPSLAEISSLATQTQFTEEQIKVWFSAQRLKHGVSWTPEEVEDARRKQFNGTVHTVPQTITVIPAHQLSAAANGLQSILQTCQIVGQSGLVFTQVGNLPVTNPITLTVAGLPSQSQTAFDILVLVKSSDVIALCEHLTVADELPFLFLFKENSALSADTFSMRPKKSKEQLAELKASYLKNHFVTDAEIARLMKVTNLTKGEIKKWFSDTRYNQRNSKNSHVIVCSSSASATIVIDSSDDNPTSPHPPCTPPVKEKETRPKTWNPFPDFTLQKFKEKTPEQLVLLEESFEKNSSPSDEELSRLRTETKLTRREIDAWFTERRKVPHVSTSSPDSSDGGKVETDGEKAVDKEEAGGANASNNLASSSCKGNQTPPGGRSKQHPSTSSKKDFKDKSKKTPEQLHILKSAFVRTQWPTPEEYDQLSGESGLPRSYIVSWFGDSRYSWKNGNLKWFFQYQSGNIEGANTGGGREILKEYYLRYSFLNEQDLDELVTKTNMSYEQVSNVGLSQSDVYDGSFLETFLKELAVLASRLQGVRTAVRKGTGKKKMEESRGEEVQEPRRTKP